MNPRSASLKAGENEEDLTESREEIKKRRMREGSKHDGGIEC
jgi:hypothetical protein